MARVFIPALLRDLTGGQAVVEAPGATLRAVLDGLELRFPGFRSRVCQPDGRLLSHIAVAVDGEEPPQGLQAPVAAHSEIHFIPAVSGG